MLQPPAHPDVRNGTSRLEPMVSVIVPAFESHDKLARCVSALLSQDYPFDRFEVLVIENGPAASGTPFTPRVTYLHQPLPGSYTARNLGIQSSKSEVLAFTDADCEPAPDWLSEGIKALSQTPRCFVGGQIQIDGDERSAITHYERVWFDQQWYIDTWGVAGTCSLFVPRKAFGAVGLFDSNLKSGGDFEWAFRAQSLGYRAIYAPRSLARHASRESREELARQHRRLLGGFFEKRLKPSLRHPRRLAVAFGHALFPALPRLIRVPFCKRKMLALVLYLAKVRLHELIRLLGGAEPRRS